jgi:hypothetical protein
MKIKRKKVKRTIKDLRALCNLMDVSTTSFAFNDKRISFERRLKLGVKRSLTVKELAIVKMVFGAFEVDNYVSCSPRSRKKCITVKI